MVFQGNERKSVEGLAESLTALSVEKMEECYRNRRNKYQVWTEEVETGVYIPVLQWQDHIWTLNSRYNPENAAKVWTQQFTESVKNDSSIVIVFGLGDGKAILELSKKKPDTGIIVYEPCQEIFWEVIGYPEVAEVICRNNVCVLVEGICEECFFHVLQELLNYSNYQLVVQAVLPNYDRLFNNEYKGMLGVYKNVVELIIYTRNTEIQRGIETQRNTYALTKDMLEQYSIVQLKGIAKKRQLEDIPAILVAAGPSLDKNVQELKNAEGKAFLMVVDTALNTVLEHGIIPDMTMSIDSRKPLTLFKNPAFAHIPIALSLKSNQEVVKKNRGRHYYEIDDMSYVSAMIEETTGKECIQLPTGGSVANNALSLLIEMGFKTIILVGQDLAYPGGVEHTKAAYNSDGDKVDFKKKNYIEVEDIYGNTVLTEANMNIYRKWVENCIGILGHIRVIDATEGGAKIAGTEIKTLEDALQECCTRKIDTNIIFAENPYFSKEEQERLKERICQIPQEIDDLEEMVKKGLKLYANLDSLNCKQKYNSSQIGKVMQKIGTLNEQIDSLAVSRMVQHYMTLTEYEVKGEILQYSEKDSVMKQLNDFVEQGTKLFKGYVEAIEELRKDIPLILEDFKHEDIDCRQ